MSGLLLFYMKGWFTEFTWAEAYYTWDKATVFFLFFTLLLYRPNKTFLVITFYSLINVLWETTVWIVGADFNSMILIDCLYIITLIIVCYLTIKARNPEWNQNS